MDKARGKVRFITFVLVLAAAGACGQTAREIGPGTIVRAFDDPACGARWLLVRDPATPGGPGRLVLAAPGQKSEMDKNPVVVRAGDRILLEEHTRLADARLEAVALSTARSGERFKARLKIGGKVVDVEAVAAGRTAFAPETRASR